MIRVSKSIGGRLLNDAAGKVELKVDKLLHGKSVGLVTQARNGVHGGLSPRKPGQARPFFLLSFLVITF